MKEARAKRSPESLRWTEERKAKQAERMKGNSFSKNPSPETRAKKSKAAKGNKNFLGKTHTEESKSKISATKTGTKLSEEHKSKISESLLGNQRTLGYKHTDEAKRKIGEAGIGRIKTPEGRARIGAASKKRFREQGMPFQLTKSTKIELVLRKIVENAGLKFIPNCKFDLFEVDVYIPKYHLAFEADGEFWHNQPGRPEKDAQRDKELLENFHLPVIRVSEDKLKQINKRDKLVTGRV